MNVGDQVFIRPDLETIRYDGVSVTEEMLDYRGTYATIGRIIREDPPVYKLQECNDWNWSGGMFAEPDPPIDIDRTTIENFLIAE